MASEASKLDDGELKREKSSVDSAQGMRRQEIVKLRVTNYNRCDMPRRNTDSFLWHLVRHQLFELGIGPA